MRVQQLRSEVDAVLVGVGTVVLDDPSLRVHWELLGRTPGPASRRIVVDGEGRTPERARVLDGSLPTIVATSTRSHRTFPPHIRTLVLGEEQVDLAALFSELPRVGVRRVLVEGGSRILASVARGGLFDRWTVYHAPRFIGGRTAPPMIAGPDPAAASSTVALDLVDVARLGEGFVATYRPGSSGG